MFFSPKGILWHGKMELATYRQACETMPNETSYHHFPSGGNSQDSGVLEALVSGVIKLGPFNIGALIVFHISQ